MEDLVGEASDHSCRDQKKEGQSLERAYFQLSTSQKLANTDFQFMTLQEGDLANTACKATMNRREVFVASSERTETARLVKEALMEEAGGLQPSREDFVAQAHAPVAKALVKPAGQPADNREISAMLALRHCADEDFVKLHRCWASFLLQEGCLFRRSADEEGPVFLSFGSRGRVAWGFQVTEVEEGIYLPAPKQLSQDEAKGRLVPMIECNLGLGTPNTWVAVPSQTRLLA